MANDAVHGGNQRCVTASVGYLKDSIIGGYLVPSVQDSELSQQVRSEDGGWKQSTLKE